MAWLSRWCNRCHRQLRSRRPLHLRNARAICRERALLNAYRSRARAGAGQGHRPLSLSGQRAHFLKVRDVGSSLSLGIRVTTDDGFTSGLRPLNRERPVRLPDNAIGCFHQVSMASLARRGQRLKSLEKTQSATDAPASRFSTINAVIRAAPVAKTVVCRAAERPSVPALSMSQNPVALAALQRAIQSCPVNAKDGCHVTNLRLRVR